MIAAGKSIAPASRPVIGLTRECAQAIKNVANHCESYGVESRECDKAFYEFSSKCCPLKGKARPKKAPRRSEAPSHCYPMYSIFSPSCSICLSSGRITKL